MNRQAPIVPPITPPMLGLMGDSIGNVSDGEVAGGVVTVSIIIFVVELEIVTQLRYAVDVKEDVAQPCWIIVVVVPYTKCHSQHCPMPFAVHLAIASSEEHTKFVHSVDMAVAEMHDVASVHKESAEASQQPWTPRYVLVAQMAFEFGHVIEDSDKYQ